jgi:hypothetical protein
LHTHTLQAQCVVVTPPGWVICLPTACILRLSFVRNQTKNFKRVQVLGKGTGHITSMTPPINTLSQFYQAYVGRDKNVCLKGKFGHKFIYFYCYTNTISFQFAMPESVTGCSNRRFSNMYISFYSNFYVHNCNYFVSIVLSWSVHWLVIAKNLASYFLITVEACILFSYNLSSYSMDSEYGCLLQYKDVRIINSCLHHGLIHEQWRHAVISSP